MSSKHFHYLQCLIEEIEHASYKEITDEVSSYYAGDFFYLCAFERPAKYRDEGPIYCRDVRELVELYEKVYPEALSKQLWFCQTCHTTGMIRYREHASVQEVLEKLHKDHAKHSCTADFQVLTTDNFEDIPEWAKKDIQAYSQEK